MRISLIHGICVRNDAISNAIADQLQWLRGAGHDVHLYAYACDRPELQCQLVHTLSDVAFDAHFQHSEVVIFHFGIYYPLFDLIPVVPRRARRLVAFHNITPKQFVAEAQHATIDRSFRQMANIAFADHVLCDSVSNQAVLRAAHIDTPATVLPLAVACAPQALAHKPSADDGIIRLAFIGRLVESKGPHDLIAALRRVLERGPRGQRLTLDVIANLGFSDPALVDMVRDAATALPGLFGERISVRLHGDATEALKQRVLAEADLFVLPTRHEGFCVPIVEALGSGCKVITYANSNTPAISGGHAHLLPSGDGDALASALANAIAHIAAPAWRAAGPGGYLAYAQQTWQYAQLYAPATIRQRFLDLITQLARFPAPQPGRASRGND